jgi:hypothetical protein
MSGDFIVPHSWEDGRVAPIIFPLILERTDREGAHAEWTSTCWQSSSYLNKYVPKARAIHEGVVDIAVIRVRPQLNVV